MKASIDIVNVEMLDCSYLTISIFLPSVIVVFGSPRKRAHDSLASQIAPGKLSYLESWFSKWYFVSKICSELNVRKKLLW